MITSANDNKNYRHITLDNGLKALLIHDATCTKSAASLAVNVGHFNDPKEHEGLAHLLEHSMFLGTEKFPDPQEYQQFIKHHGGEHNAWTGSEFTNYYFSINNEQFITALERFSDFFHAPLLDPQWVAKEIEAVDSEFRLKQNDDNRRLNAVIKETVNQFHPFSQFSVGNKQTLATNSDGPITTLRSFYQAHYSSDKMNVVLLSHLSLDELEVQSHQFFGAIEQRKSIKTFPQIALYTKEQHSVEISVVPDKDIKRLTLSFEMAVDDINYCCKPISYLAFLFGHEGEGSLLSRLKALDLANSLSAGAGLSGYNYREFSINIALTDLGLNSIDQIIGLVFQVIDIIKEQGVDSWRYTEQHNIMNVAFDFQEPPKAIDLVSHLSINMFKFKPKDIVYGDYAMDSFEPDAIMRCLQKMSAQTIRIVVLSQSNSHDRRAKWYDTPYKVSPINPQRRQLWLCHPKDPSLSLPPPNPFVVERLAYRKPTTAQYTPSILIDEAGIRVWHLPESKFNVPKGHIFTAIDSPNVGNDIKYQVLLRLYVELLHDSLAQVTFPAEIAGMHYDIYPHASGLTMHVSGYTPKLFIFFEILITKIRQREFPLSRFNEIKHQLEKNWKDQRKAKPINRLFKGLSATLQPHQFDYPVLLEALEYLTLKDVQAFISTLFSNIHLESYVQGDWPTREVRLFGESLHRQIANVAKAHPPIPRQVHSIEAQGTIVRQLTNTSQQAAVIMYFQSQCSIPREIALWSLANQIINPKFFSSIRTKQQLGYVCGTSYMPINRYPGIMLYIQSTVADPNVLINAIDDLLATINEHLSQLNSQQWQQLCDGMASQMKTTDTSAHQQASRYWTSICNRDLTFKHRDETIAALRNISCDQLMDFIANNMISVNVNRLIMTTTISDNEPLVIKHKQITDVKTFKRHAPILFLTPD